MTDFTFKIAHNAIVFHKRGCVWCDTKFTSLKGFIRHRIILKNVIFIYAYTILGMQV